MASLTFTRATRQARKLKIGIQGPSGAGKTIGALKLARGLVGPAGKIAVIDTENSSASLYADRVEFDTLNLEPPYESKYYVEAIRAAVEAGYDAVVIDSLSHQWAGKGGILDRKEQLDKRGGNQYTNWAPFTKEHEAFKDELKAAPVHLICCLRTKQDYVLEQNEKGKQTPKKVGLAAVQREGLEYEFDIAFELQMDHRAAASKDRTSLFDEQLTDLCDATTARRLLAWLASGAPADSRPLPAAAPAPSNGARANSNGTHADGNGGSPAPAGAVDAGSSTDTAIELALRKFERGEFGLADAQAFPLPWKKSEQYGQPLGGMSRGHLESLVAWCEEGNRMDSPRNAALHTAASLVLEDIDRSQGTLALDGAGAPSEAEGVSSGPVAMPAPGEVADALVAQYETETGRTATAEDEAAARQSAAAGDGYNSVRAISMRITELAGSEMLDEADRQTIRRDLVACKSNVKQLQALEAKVRKLVDDSLPF